MRLWRAKWIAKEFLAGAYARQRIVLRKPWIYWLALMLKAVPGLWPFTIRLHTKDGFVIPVREFMTLYIFKEIFVDGCYDIELPAAPRILDVGANTGLFDLRMKQLYPAALIHAYEPMPAVFEQLEETTRGLKDVSIHRFGIGVTSGRANLYIHSRNIGGHSLYAELTDGAGHVEIELVALDTAIASLGTVDLLKLDCEGAEVPLIMSLTRDSPVAGIIWEATTSLYDPAAVKRHLQAIGYQVSCNSAGTMIARRVQAS